MINYPLQQLYNCHTWTCDWKFPQPQWPFQKWTDADFENIKSALVGKFGVWVGYCVLQQNDGV